MAASHTPSQFVGCTIHYGSDVTVGPSMARASGSWLSYGWERTCCITKTDAHLDSLQTVMLLVVSAPSGWSFPDEYRPFVGL